MQTICHYTQWHTPAFAMALITKLSRARLAPTRHGTCWTPRRHGHAMGAHTSLTLSTTASVGLAKLIGKELSTWATAKPSSLTLAARAKEAPEPHGMVLGVNGHHHETSQVLQYLLVHIPFAGGTQCTQDNMEEDYYDEVPDPDTVQKLKSYADFSEKPSGTIMHSLRQLVKLGRAQLSSAVKLSLWLPNWWTQTARSASCSRRLTKQRQQQKKQRRHGKPPKQPTLQQKQPWTRLTKLTKYWQKKWRASPIVNQSSCSCSESPRRPPLLMNSSRTCFTCCRRPSTTSGPPSPSRPTRSRPDRKSCDGKLKQPCWPTGSRKGYWHPEQRHQQQLQGHSSSHHQRTGNRHEEATTPRHRKKRRPLACMALALLILTMWTYVTEMKRKSLLMKMKINAVTGESGLLDGKNEEERERKDREGDGRGSGHFRPRHPDFCDGKVTRDRAFPTSTPTSSPTIRIHCANITTWGPKAQCFWTTTDHDYDIALFLEHHVAADKWESLSDTLRPSKFKVMGNPVVKINCSEHDSSFAKL